MIMIKNNEDDNNNKSNNNNIKITIEKISIINNYDYYFKIKIMKGQEK